MASDTNNAFTVKGLRIKTVNILVIVASVLLCIALALGLISIRRESEALVDSSYRTTSYREYAQTAKEASYYLTEQVHLFVTTGDKQFADNYFEEVNVAKRRETALASMRDLAITSSSSAHELLIGAIEQSDKLMEREIYAIRLVAEANGDDLAGYDERVALCDLSRADTLLTPDEKRTHANNIVFNDAYLSYRTDID